MIYVLGGNGFVGSAFRRLFTEKGIEHSVITRENYPSFIGSSCDVLVNAGGNSSKIKAARDPLFDFEATVASTRRLLHDIRCDFYIHLSSCDVYPDCSSPLISREDSPPTCSSLGPYGFHKYLAELCAAALSPKWLVIRQGGFVGPGMKKNAIYDILFGDKLWLHPDSRLQYLHTDDSAGLVWKLYSDGIENEIVNVCGDGTVRLADVMAWAGRAPELSPDAIAPAHYEVNIDKLRSRCRVPKTADTVRRFVETVKAHGAGDD